ncbi:MULTISPECIES: thioesterase II family protein [Streptomycetaceae]|uniref:Thioesterase n=1 Tax=Streptantibioticus cattleyicolor (strain ATCC 35852 / DSM 46488 / JCM 4925 / NBRC 14057 / NRRL 8057) TaxID=1003195 RepID=F8K3C1_STREN|nr:MULTISPECIES: alpha/beta fold hydrolase [Streptomycetaceae]AEW95033.1 thioesterase [Streptantibioticus cattleyicolor NRRL 8057 = DSM 46488]MYS59632.1 alpha/beta fold hydrolase [Streptomyces sp. SID5468]CCB75385.1 Predicted thioesterase involved in non-ribosomal peptide biosynthesis [Streptantibioticus cattleyicolor NRRL 8057 = DSM 46488]
MVVPIRPGGTVSAPLDTWLRRPRPVAAPRLRLVCFPHAGGAASFFREWPGWLPADVEVAAVCYPGREDRILDDCVADMAGLADPVADALAGWTDRPLVFFGHSMGASVAHEVALRMEARHGDVVRRLLVSSRAAPPRLNPSGLSRQGDEALLADVFSLGGAFSEVLNDPDIRELMLPAIRADYRLLDDYRPDPDARLNAPVSAFVGDDDPHVPVADMESWAQVTRGGFELTVFPGDHFYLVPRGPELAGRIGESLTRG